MFHWPGPVRFNSTEKSFTFILCEDFTGQERGNCTNGVPINNIRNADDTILRITQPRTV